MKQEEEEYVSSILGQKTVYELEEGGTDDTSITRQLLRADSLWNTGKANDAAKLVARIKQHPNYNDDTVHGAFARGLEALSQNSLSTALIEFKTASQQQQSQKEDTTDNNDLLWNVFFAERAVNIAFWMACTEEMLHAGLLVESEIDTTPYAGGILAFCIHMAGDSTKAESIARTAINKGFDDPWTLHAVAHALYSLGRSQECAAWLIDHRSQVEQCSPFMRGHFEFHLGLVLIDMEDSAGLASLIQGPLWGSMALDMKEDYWNAAGLLNILWKAELRGVTSKLTLAQYTPQKREALQLLENSAADPARSCVFSLCILRWTTAGSFRERWKAALFSSSNQTLVAMARAVDIIYSNSSGENNNDYAPSVEQHVWVTAAKEIAPMAEHLDSLGASPEQREVIEEFVGIVGNRSQQDGSTSSIDLKSWDARNRRPNVPFYDSIFRQE
jgi:hypothetical protein